ncbi:MAG: toxin-antitoxin system YwqK family antitoxin [Waddliaceae bacterium]|nr:toxin-antitoxin system YwqK family antitoxin [Waddliaceae bacterium]
MKIPPYISKTLLIIIMPLFLIGCSSIKTKENPTHLSRVHIIDNNGFTETIHSKERLTSLRNINFLKSQPYQKVLRTFQRNKSGSTKSIITTYYDHGQIKQYLEVVDSRAYGVYKEWHHNGVVKLETRVIGGVSDIPPSAEKSWVFDGTSRAWSEEGHLLAEIYYEKGELHGLSKRYHLSGVVHEETPYHHNALHGTTKIFRADGSLFSQAEFSQGEKHGTSFQYWKNGSVAAQENYSNGSLMSGKYIDNLGIIRSEIVGGEGFRSIFKGKILAEQHEYKHGKPEGLVTIFDENSTPLRTYHIKNEVKHGEEIEFFTKVPKTQQKLSINWSEGKIQGLVKTWYDNGIQESSREMSMNKKNGISTAWFRNGSLMLIEEFQDDVLLRGEYHKKGEKYPVSKVTGGNGEATLYDPDGNFLKKIIYVSGLPAGT